MTHVANASSSVANTDTRPVFKVGDKVRCIRHEAFNWNWEYVGKIVTVKEQCDDGTFKCFEHPQWISNYRYIIDEASVVDQILTKYGDR